MGGTEGEEEGRREGGEECSKNRSVDQYQNHAQASSHGHHPYSIPTTHVHKYQAVSLYHVHITALRGVVSLPVFLFARGQTNQIDAVTVT